MTRAMGADTRIFVFGTLKQGFPNFHLNTGQRLAGSYNLVLRYPLYLVGDRKPPWLVDNPGLGYRVCGQLFDVDSAALEAMDLLERTTADDGYRRQQARVANPEGKVSEVFVYLKPLAQYSEVLSGGEQVTGPYPEYTRDMAMDYRPRLQIENARAGKG